MLISEISQEEKYSMFGIITSIPSLVEFELHKEFGGLWIMNLTLGGTNAHNLLLLIIFILRGKWLEYN